MQIPSTLSAPLIETVQRGRWLQVISPGGFEWTRATLTMPDLPPSLDGLSIVHLTDLHLRSTWFKAYDELLDQLRRESPDLVLITGDFVEHRLLRRKAVLNAERFCRGLTARLGVFAVVGNHDGDFLAPRISGWGVTLVENSLAVLSATDGATIELIGLPGVFRLDFDALAIDAIPVKPANALRIVLSHFPDHIRYISALSADLVFAGHTHGGQICLPGRMPIITHDSLPRIYCSGVHRWEQSWLVVARGLGFATIPVRAFCPTEVMEVVLRRAT
jgi:predicted MPP superfamily phosphohydrolase